MLKHKFLDAILLALVILASVFLYRFVSGNKELEENVASQNFKANSLIEEIGQAKQENYELFQRLNESQRKVEDLKDAVEYLKQVVNAPQISSISQQKQQEEQQKIARPADIVSVPPTFNFLLVGQNGHLADSIIIAAADERAQKVTLISIPRDLFINGRKMSEYLSWYGIDVLKAKIEAVSGLKIHKYFVINFQAFENIIDALGGIDVYVEKDIYDPQYPNGAGGYTLYAVKAGSHHFSGAEALKYSRSRHSTSDFDRARRQQKVLKAVQERVINFDFLKNTDGLKTIYESVFNMVETDIPLAEMIEYLTRFQNFAVSSGNVISTSDFLDSSLTVSGQYILLPKSGNFAKIQKYIWEILN